MLATAETTENTTATAVDEGGFAASTMVAIGLLLTCVSAVPAVPVQLATPPALVALQLVPGIVTVPPAGTFEQVMVTALPATATDGWATQ